ncbi:MAG: DsbA family protein [Microthrixaceae bacterium]|nr:DsbA family protein [Microthrixaceae bacterium]
MLVDQRPKLIVYGDFNCPFSALASARVGYLERHGFADVDWRAVEHAPDIPSQGLDLIGDQRDELRGELDQIRSLLTDGEANQLTLPAIQSNTRRATLAYAATPTVDRPRLRQRLFAAYWMHQADLADPETLLSLGAINEDEPTASRWQDEWLALPRPIVPVIVLPDGYVSRGLGALARLVQLATNRAHDEMPDTTVSEAKGKPKADPTDLGGESPCFAHLFEEREGSPSADSL